ncbi:MAG: Hpt domain-containing protein [Planctomycetota bacterium]|jgi:chemotaxis protein histidine kinase CheA|nr:Hpt domain-containing protein [Planctomycetota bacterium]
MTGSREQSADHAGGAKTGLEIERMPVKISHLDTLLGLTGEIIIAASNISILQRHLTTSETDVDKETVEMVKLASLTTNRISSDLHRLVMDIRMVPIKDTFLRFRRLVRDIAKKRGRQVDFEIVGEDTLVDKTVAERLYEPLAHQIRNAIDHGLEDPLERQHEGKPPTGSLVLTAYKKEGFTYVSVADDGKGLDEARIRQVAVEKGYAAGGTVRNMSTDELWRLIMTPGFSTAREATEISGRGVGMDVVKNAVEAMGGEILIESTPGGGSTFTYKIPQLSAVNITDAVIIRADDSYFAVPVGNVVATQSISDEDINTTMGQTENILYLDSILPLHDLLHVLTGTTLTQSTQGDSMPIIIIEAKNGRIACKVSEFIRPQKLVLIPLPEGFDVKGVSGTTILGGSQIGMIIEPFELVAMAMGTGFEDEFSSRSSIAMGEEARRASIPLETKTPGASQQAARPEGAAGAEVRPLSDTRAMNRLEMDQGVAEEFFIEIQDILKELNEDIFQIEKDPENAARVNTIFRHFHSIKGNFMMTGFNNVAAFVHEVESVLDRIREKTLSVNQEIIDLLLDAVKNLEGGLVRIRSGRNYEIEDRELLATLSKYHRMETKVEEREIVADDDGVFRMSPLGTLLYHAKMSAPRVNVFQSMIELKPSFQDPSLVAYLIIKRLTMIADIIDSVPSLERIEKGLARNKLKIMFASAHTLDEVNRFFTKQLSRYYSAEMFENLVME